MHPPPDVLFCGNDQIARGAAELLRDLGIAIPADVAIVGFDNRDVMALAARPPLTSIDMNLRTLGREAGDRLIEMIAGKQLSGIRRRPCSLIVRQSTGAECTDRGQRGRKGLGMGRFAPVRFVDVQSS